jgi:hypothetical protein
VIDQKRPKPNRNTDMGQGRSNRPSATARRSKNRRDS